MAFRRPDVGWAAGVTFANYELMASPLLFVAFFIATAGPVRPMAVRARIIYALLIGAGPGRRCSSTCPSHSRRTSPCCWQAC